MAEALSTPRTPIGLFRAGLTAPDRLEQTTIGREEMLADLLEKLQRSTGKKTHQHYAFIGPRGIGKTHFLSLLVHRIESSPDLCGRFTVVRFAEETHRLLSFADFLLRICEILTHTPDAVTWQEQYAELAEEDDDQRIIDALEPKLNRYRKDTGRILLLLLENLDEVLTRQIKSKQDIHRLRKFLMTSPSCILVATAPLTFPGLTDVKQPFYDFFDIQTLENLTQQQTVDVIRANLQYDQRRELLERFDELSPKIKALHEMTGGSPRLVIMHYALIADENVLEVRRQFEELLDRISPFYQDRIKDLPPQERAVLETMALIRSEPKTPALLARKLRKSPQQTSSLLQRLTKSGYLVVMDHPDDKRSKIYRIKEGFFDLWLSMNESRKQRKRLPALTEFFELWYQREEREQKRRALVDQLLADKSAPAAADHRVATLEYLADIGTDDEKIAAKTWVAAALQESGRPQQVAAYLDEVKALKPHGVMQWLTRQGELWTDNARWPDPIKQVEEMIACWELQRAGHLEEFTSQLLKIGRSLQGRGLHQALADLFLSSAQELEDSEAKIEIMLQAARSQLTAGDLSSALNTFQAALQIAVDTGNHRLDGTTLNNLAAIHHRRGEYDNALEYLEQALEICREIGNRSGEGATLNNLSQIYDSRRDYDRALEYLEQALAIGREIGDRSGEGTTLNNLSQIYGARGDYDRALEYLEQALAISREIGDRSVEGTTRNNLSQIYDARRDYDRALAYLEQALAISREIGDRSVEGTTLNNLSQIYDARGDYDRALEYLGQALAIHREIGNRSGMCVTLFNLGHIQRTKQDTEAAMSSWITAFQIAKETGLAKALDALEALAKQMGQEDGLGFWDSLSAKATVPGKGATLDP